MTQNKNIEMPPYLNASYEGDDLFSGQQLIAAVLAEREACAKVADEYMRNCEGRSFGVGTAIRVRGEQS